MGKRTPEESAQIAREAQQKGFKGIKIKCGGGGFQLTLDRVQAISQVVDSDFELVLDSNGGFFNESKDRFLDTIELARQLEAYNVTILEDPFPREEVEATAELRKHIRIPIAYQAQSIERAIHAIRWDACDYMNVGGDWGLVDFMLTSDIADAAKIPSWHGASMELGVRSAAYLHACAASKGCTLSSDIHHYLWEDDLIAHPIEIKEGRARVPEGPGLGVELDHEALEHYLVKQESIVPVT
jgi:muconate cycloisomerase